MAEANDKEGEAKDKDIKFERLIDSMETMLGSIDNEYIQIQACSISIVPDQLRKSNEDVYMPKVVSIGPLHRGTRRESRDLLYMEEIKWRCMKSLLTRKQEDAPERLRKCSEAMFKLNEVVRASYVDDIKLNDYDLSKIMLLDGCFLLELLISGSERKEEVLSDLTVLENQIPLIILKVLSEKLLEKDFTKEIEKHALSLLGYSLDSSIDYSANAAHFLELFHSFITGKLGKEMAESKSSSNTGEIEKIEESQESNNMSNSEDREKVKEIQESKDLSISVGSDKAESKVEKNHLELKLKRCATRLKAAGVSIEPPDSKSAESRQNNTAPTEFRFDFGIKFSDGKLEIPPLHITKTTEVMWRNFIAWEQNRTDHAKFVVLEQSGTRTSCKFSSYALFFQGLICCEHDIQLLKDRKVIVVHDEEGSNQDRKKKNKMSNEDLLNFFSKITEGVQIDIDSSFSKLFKDLNTYQPAVDRARENRIIVWHYCRRVLTGIAYICRNWYAVLIRDHIPTVWKLVAVLAATALLGLTIAQTIFAARSQ